MKQKKQDEEEEKEKGSVSELGKLVTVWRSPSNPLLLIVVDHHYPLEEYVYHTYTHTHTQPWAKHSKTIIEFENLVYIYLLTSNDIVVLEPDFSSVQDTQTYISFFLKKTQTIRRNRLSAMDIYGDT